MSVRAAAEAEIEDPARIWHGGWRRAGTVVYQADTTTGTMPLEVWRYEKRLRAHVRRGLAAEPSC